MTEPRVSGFIMEIDGDQVSIDSECKSVEEIWESYAAAIYADKIDVSPVQYTETRLAFYAGCWSMLQEAFKISSDQVNIEDGISRLDSVYREIREFQKRYM